MKLCSSQPGAPDQNPGACKTATDGALAASELRYRRLFEAAKDGILILNAESGMIVDVNPYLIDLLGYSRAEFLGKKVWELGVFKNLAANEAKFLELQAREYVRYEDLPLETIDGRSIAVEFVSNVYHENNLRVIQCNIRNITERKRADVYWEMGREVLETLNGPEEWKEAIRHVLDILKSRTGFHAVGIRLKDGEDFPYIVQDGFPKDFLLPENSLIARAADGGVCRDPTGNISLECTCGLVISGKTDPSNPLFTRGGSFWTNNSLPLLDLAPGQDPRLHPRNQCIHQGYTSVALIPIRSKNQIVGLIQFNDRHKGCFTPETVELLEGIASHIGTALMRKMIEAEKAMLTDQLRQSQKLEAVGRLAGGVAHDFNNMLGIILGYIELAMDKMDPDQPIYADLLEIRAAADRAANLTRQLLAFARKQTIAPKVLDLNDAVANTLKMLHQLIGENIHLVWLPGVNLQPVKMDPSQVDQILVNLCSNARDAINEVGKIVLKTGNITIHEDDCTRLPDALPGIYAFLSVRDDGHGIAPDVLPYIFEPFFTTKGKGLGTGLGLATVYGIIRQNNGFITVKSTPDSGTTITVHLPQAPAGSREMRKSVMHQTPRGQGETVLLVEDEISLHATLRLFLNTLGYTVLPATTPSNALEMAIQHAGQIHIMLTDVIMPGMDGRQLAEQVRAARPDIKVVFMSGYPADVIARHGILEANTAFLAKPFTRSELAHKLHETLEVRKDPV